MAGGDMGIKCFRVQRLVTVTLLCVDLLAAFPGTGAAVKTLDPPFVVPKAFRQLDASVTGLRFFATTTLQFPPNQAKAYSESFTPATPYIGWELCLKTKAKRNRHVPIDIWVTWRRPDGSEFYQSVCIYIPPNLDKPCMFACEKDKRPGGWAIGIYSLTIQIGDIKVASGSFKVFQKILEGH
jgi:hypothetical protein